MKECKCERRLSDPLDPPSEETMQMACDVLEHHLKLFRELNRRSKLPIEVTEEHIKIINRFMEEKKTKKMTKAEAFEWLKNKKVYVGGHSASIQATLFEAGFKWPFSHNDIQHLSQPFLFINEKGEITYDNDMLLYREHSYKEITAEDILSLEIEEECAKDDEDPYFEGRIKDLQEMLEDDEVLIITKTNFLTMTK